MNRLRALISKELLDLSRNKGALIPVALATATALVMPFGIAIVAPAMSGHPLSDDKDLAKLAMFAAGHDDLALEGKIQLFLFQQFLMFFLVMPITGAMSLAAHAVVGEKQARTLEPLLATPITTIELVVAKVLGALLPTFAIAMTGLALYFVGLLVLAEPGVLRAMSNARTWCLILLVGPAAALVSLQAAIVISSRVNDPRTAQQFSVLIILPVTGIVVAQFVGSIQLSATTLFLVGVALTGIWILLVLLSVAVFERESILTRWR